MKALSVRAPWWWAILHGKPVENREWYSGFRGRFWLHASKFWKIDEIIDDWDDVKYMAAQDNLALPLPIGNQAATDLCAAMREAGGCIVGSVEMYDCIQQYPAHIKPSAYFVGRYGFLLRDPIILPKPIPFKGALGFFDVPDEIAQ